MRKIVIMAIYSFYSMFVGANQLTMHTFDVQHSTSFFINDETRDKVQDFRVDNFLECVALCVKVVMKEGCAYILN